MEEDSVLEPIAICGMGAHNHSHDPHIYTIAINTTRHQVVVCLEESTQTRRSGICLRQSVQARHLVFQKAGST